MTKLIQTLIAGIIFSSLGMTVQAEDTAPSITILSTMVANYTGEGEWGFSALIETGEEAILFDTGFKEGTVLHNAKALGKDLSTVEKVILSHFHSDHTGGLLLLRKTLMETNPKALTTAYVGKGFFDQRYRKDGAEAYSLPNPGFTESFISANDFRAAAEALGITFIVVSEPTEITNGIVLTGPVERTHDERNVSPGFFLKTSEGLMADTVPESQSLGIKTSEGWTLISGCGHAGMINTAEKLTRIENRPIHMAIGGFHLFKASDETVTWTAEQLKRLGTKKIVGAHCTGAHATFELSEILGIERRDMSIGAIGTRIDGDMTIHPASIE
jgi:7,8-dihydropterin-6-yl-methyl-4-(beta-D-ribofuranosyl)aminobenzene 5'-phosphate synthase